MTLVGRKIFLGGLIAFALCASVYLYLHAGGYGARDTGDIKIESRAYYPTPDKQLTTSRVIAAYKTGAFTPINTAVLNKGIADQYYWIYFTVNGNPDSTGGLLLNVDNARLNEIELFEVNGYNTLSLGKQGDFFPFQQRPIKSKNFLYSVTAGKSYLLFVNQVGSTFILPMGIVTRDNFYAAKDRDLFADGIVYGILLFVALMSLLFFLASDHMLYFYYSAYIITGVAWLFSYFGMGYAYIWGNSPAANTAMAPITASLNVFFNLQICQALLKLHTTKKQLNTCFELCKILLLASGAFPILFNLNRYGYTVNHAYLLAFLCIILVSMLLVTYTVVTNALKKSVAARLYLFASLVKAGGIINLALLELGIAPAVMNMEEILQAGILAEILLLTYALASRYAVYKLKTFAKVIEAHEKERSIVSKEIHDSISNSLTGIHYGIDDIITAEKHISATGTTTLKKLSAALKRLHSEARDISHNVMPDYINNYSLSDIISRYIEELKSRRPDARAVSINFSSGKEIFEFSQEVKLNIFRIVQEILTNVLKHSRATQADIVLDFLKNRLVIIAEDNGTGLQNTLGADKGRGMENIASRVELLQGDMKISSHLTTSAGNNDADAVQPHYYGTYIEIKIPYRANAQTNTTDAF